MDPEDVDQIAPDGGWGWLVLAGTILVSTLIPGMIKSFGVLFVEFMEVFNATPVVASWIPALCYFLYCSLGPLSSYLCTKTSYRMVTFIGGVFASSGMILSYFANSIEFLYISYGVLVGIGAGLSYPPGIYIVTSYFVKLRGLANGLAVSGSAFGSIVLPPFLRYLLEQYGYRGATLIMGGMTLNVLGAALLYEPVEKHLRPAKPLVDASDSRGRSDTLNSGPCDMTRHRRLSDRLEAVVVAADGRRWSDALASGPWNGSIILNPEQSPKTLTVPSMFLSHLTDPVFLVLLFSNSSSFIGYVNFTILVPAYAVQLGYDKDQAATLLSIVSGFDLVGRVGGSALSDLLPINKSAYFFGGLFVSGVALTLLPLATSYTAVASVCALFGLASGTAIGVVPVVMAHFMGDDKLITSYGLCLFFGGLLQLLGPPVCGLTFEYIKRYGPIFTCLGIVLMFGSCGSLIMPHFNKKHNLRSV